MVFKSFRNSRYMLQGMYTKYGQTAAGLSNTLSDVWVQVPASV